MKNETEEFTITIRMEYEIDGHYEIYSNTIYCEEKWLETNVRQLIQMIPKESECRVVITIDTPLG